MLRDVEGFSPISPVNFARDLANSMAEALTLRSAIVGTVRPEYGDVFKPKSENYRTRLAVRFGDQQTEATDTQRPTQVRVAFNSPFWPFVLASTSVGQEGLDFHLYCHSVVHWNLPHNPVDLEQREGRVHRYKGHAVRRNAAREFGTQVLRRGSEDPWRDLFQMAADAYSDESEIVPFWVLPLEGGAHIERHVPTLPLSRDAAKLANLRQSLVLYRMVFGQPRQEELVDYLRERLPEEELTKLAEELRIDLTPPA